jgi:hypothetical protein
LTVRFDTGHPADDKATAFLIQQLVGMHLPADMDMNVLDGSMQYIAALHHLNNPQVNVHTAGRTQDLNETRSAAQPLVQVSANPNALSQSLSEYTTSFNMYDTYKDAMTGLAEAGDSASRREDVVGESASVCGDPVLTAVERCRDGFDESNLFQVDSHLTASVVPAKYRDPHAVQVPETMKKGSSYLALVQEKNQLMEEFRMRWVVTVLTAS